MHIEVERFIKNVREEFPSRFRFKKILECGSQNINGSPRKYFWFCDYYGIDICKGKGVDEVVPIHEFKAPDVFHVVISTEMLEHDVNWKASLKTMYENLKEEGLLLITCAGPRRPEHGTVRTSPESSLPTTDYYHNITVEEFESVLKQDMFITYVLQYSRGSNDLQFYGIKKIKTAKKDTFINPAEADSNFQAAIL